MKIIGSEALKPSEDGQVALLATEDLETLARAMVRIHAAYSGYPQASSNAVTRVAIAPQTQANASADQAKPVSDIDRLAQQARDAAVGAGDTLRQIL